MSPKSRIVVLSILLLQVSFSCSNRASSGRCGDGRMDPGEECDGPGAGGAACSNIDLSFGTPVCTPACKLTPGTCTNTHVFGTDLDDGLIDVKVDTAGNVIVVGHTEGKLGAAAFGGLDVLVMKLNSSFQPQWTLQMGTPGKDTAASLALDAAGNAYVVGNTDGAFPGFANQGHSDTFLLKIDTKGTLVWSKQWGSAEDDTCSSLVVQEKNGVYVASPKQLHFTNLQGTGDQTFPRFTPTAVTVDASGSLILAGVAVVGHAEARPTTTWVSSGGDDEDVLIVKLKPDGTEAWRKTFGTTFETAYCRQCVSSGTESVTKVATDKAGNIFVAGVTDGNMDEAKDRMKANWEGEKNIERCSGTKPFLMKLDPTGGLSWTKIWGARTKDMKSEGAREDDPMERNEDGCSRFGDNWGTLTDLWITGADEVVIFGENLIGETWDILRVDGAGRRLHAESRLPLSVEKARAFHPWGKGRFLVVGEKPTGNAGKHDAFMTVLALPGLLGTSSPWSPNSPAPPAPPAEKNKPSVLAPAGPKQKFELYVMSQCPYGIEAEKGIKPLLDQLGHLINFKLDYIVNPMPDGTFKSLHGQPEVEGNIVQLCANKLAPEKFWTFLECQNRNMREVHVNWKVCAQEAGIDVAKLSACMNGQEGKDLLTASAARAKAANAMGSPTILLNGKPFKGGRSAMGFLRGFCAEVSEPKPLPCTELKPPPVVQVIFLTDSRCKECAKFERGLEQVKRMVAGAVVKKVDYTTEEGKKIYDEAKLTLLPVLLTDENLKQDEEAYKKLARFLTPAGPWIMVKAFPQIFDPRASSAMTP